MRSVSGIRLLAFFGVAWACLAVTGFAPSPISFTAALWAQGDDEADDEGGDEDADGGAAKSGDEKKDKKEKDKKEKDKTYLEWIRDALGWEYSIVFLFISLTFVALLVMNLLNARRESVCPLSLVEGFETHLTEGQFQEAYDLSNTDESFLGHVLAAGLAKVSTGGYAEAIEAMQEVGEEETMKMEHRLSYIALIGTISPMVGLFGTVHGMIDSFTVIAIQGSTPDASSLANGISTALFTTLVGLFIAIPAIVAFNILKNKVARLVLEVGVTSEGLMSRFQQKQG
jgi:biopolymer transport protein ExbB